MDRKSGIIWKFGGWKTNKSILYSLAETDGDTAEDIAFENESELW
jgi:hypothetical protein